MDTEKSVSYVKKDGTLDTTQLVRVDATMQLLALIEPLLGRVKSALYNAQGRHFCVHIITLGCYRATTMHFHYQQLYFGCIHAFHWTPSHTLPS